MSTCVATFVGCVEKYHGPGATETPATPGTDDPEPEPDPDPDPADREEPLPDLGVASDFDWDGVYLEIPLPDGVTADDITVEVPPLKYGKRFAYSYTFDDDVVQAYGKAFCTVNGKWVDDEKFFHVGQARSSGKTHDGTLGYTDGCGNERRFTFGIAVWPDSGNAYIDNFMAPSGKKADRYYPYLVWRDMVPLLDFGCDMYLHDVDTSYGTDVGGILEGMSSAQKATKEMLGRGIKVLARPNGDNTYVTAGRQDGDIVFMAVENTIDDGSSPLRVKFASAPDLYNRSQYRRYTEPVADADKLLVDIASAAASADYPWLHDFSHAPADFQYILDLFTAVNDRYGKDGDDSVWFATLDEIYEYNHFRRNCTIAKSVDGNILTLKFSCPSAQLPDAMQFHRDFSVVVRGAELPEGAEIATGGNVYGLSFARRADGSLFVNLDCNKSLLDKAERYTAAYEKGGGAVSKEDALYFVGRLKESLRQPFEKRLE